MFRRSGWFEISPCRPTPEGHNPPSLVQLLTLGLTHPEPPFALLQHTFVGDPRRFRSCRHFASYLGLTPRERSSGNRRRLGAISKQGNVYLRMLLIHGGRTLLWSAHRKGAKPSALQKWGLRLHTLRGHNTATVALANKLARTVWAVWTQDTAYEADRRAA